MYKGKKTPDQRKAESMAFLKSRGVPVIAHLPPLESESETRLQPPSDAARRVICLVFAADFAQGHASASHWQYIEQYCLRDWFSAEEWEFLTSKRPDDQMRVNMSWRIEGAYLLLWALGGIKKLPFPTTPANPGDVYSCLPPFSQSPNGFVHAAALIPKSKILDCADLIYRLHWATRQASLEQTAMPANLHDGVVREWHHAINWLTCYGDDEWDDVSTDT